MLSLLSSLLLLSLRWWSLLSFLLSCLDNCGPLVWRVATGFIWTPGSWVSGTVTRCISVFSAYQWVTWLTCGWTSLWNGAWQMGKGRDQVREGLGPRWAWGLEQKFRIHPSSCHMPKTKGNNVKSGTLAMILLFFLCFSPIFLFHSIPLLPRHSTPPLTHDCDDIAIFPLFFFMPLHSAAPATLRSITDSQSTDFPVFRWLLSRIALLGSTMLTDMTS